MPYDLVGSTSLLAGVQDLIQCHEINENTTESGISKIWGIIRLCRSRMGLVAEPSFFIATQNLYIVIEQHAKPETHIDVERLARR